MEASKAGDFAKIEMKAFSSTVSSLVVDSVETMVPSIYSPLSRENREIRLLTIIPSPDKSTPIHCTSGEISLSKSPGYHALSYTWGDASITVPIFVDGIEIQVTKNLEAFLRHVRPKDRPANHSHLRLWIDAICINQSDLAERSHQVQLMGDIYSHASMVMVWLGEVGADGRLAIDTLFRLYQVSRSGGEDKEKQTEAALEAINDLDGTPSLTALISFFNRPWWNRLWTVQEYAVAKNVLFACGEHTFKWELVYWWSGIVATKHFPAKWKYKRSTYLRVVGLQGCAAIMAKSFIRQQVLQYNSSQQDLAYILGYIDCMLCTDPRDRFYGIQGLAIDGGSFDAPDYTISVSELYTKVATTMAKTYQNLHILHHRCPHLRVAPDGLPLPSWVPDWARIGYPRSLDLKKYSAAKSRKAIFRFSHLPSPILHAQGIVWDIITGLENLETRHLYHLWETVLPQSVGKSYGLFTLTCKPHPLFMRACRAHVMYTVTTATAQYATSIIIAISVVAEISTYAWAVLKMVLDVGRMTIE